MLYPRSPILLGRWRPFVLRADPPAFKFRHNEGSPLYMSPNFAHLDSFACFYLTDSLCSKLDQERKARCPSQQKLKGELTRGNRFSLTP